MQKWLDSCIIWYQKHISPFKGGASCRFYPTCSTYMREAIALHGSVKGSWLGLKRIFQCHKFTKRPFYDPVPKKRKK